MGDSVDTRDPAITQPVTRRAFVKSAGAAAIVAGGIEGILAARRAPAFAQGTKLHWVRWVDFIPESDVELKRQMPEASKALGAEVVLETINANDLQPRITAAIQSGSGADIFLMQYNWPQLYQNALVDVSDVASELGEGRGRLLRHLPARVQCRREVALRPALGPGQCRRLPPVLAEGGGRQRVSQDVGRGAQALRHHEEEGQALWPDPRPHVRRRAGVHLYLTWAFGAAETDQSGKKVVLNSKGAVEAVKFMQAFWKECCDEGGLAWDDTNNNRAFHAGEICATLNGASIYIVAKRQKDKIKDDKGEPMWTRHRPRALARRPRGGVSALPELTRTPS